jgi:hypothetical protein
MAEWKQRVSIFDYVIVAPYLRAQLAEIQKMNRTFSARAWSEKLQAPDSGSFSRMLSGKRGIPKRLSQRISDYLKLNTVEKAYFELLCSGAISQESLSLIQNVLKREFSNQDSVAV